VLYHWHGGTITRHSQVDTAAPEPFVEISLFDAEHLGVDNGTLVRVTSRRGSIDLRARVTEKAVKGVVFIPFHYAEAAANVLTNDALDPLAKIPEYKVSAVRIQRLA
jgi:predicted molibdopterin-dependent oxidoreductase YjgC